MRGDGSPDVTLVALANARGPQDMKKDAGKLPLELLPVEALEEIAKVLQFGAKKYEAEKWREGIAFKRVAGAILRHSFAWIRGEDLDPETGYHHLAHCGCEVLFALTYALKGRTDLDDRIKP